MPSPTVTRSSLLRGPGNLTYDSLVLFSQQNINANTKVESWRPQISTHGEGAPRISDATGEITFTPTGRITAAIIAALFPAGLRNPTIGSRLFPATDVPLLIHAMDQTKLQFTSAALSKMPSLALSPKGTVFGDAAFMAVIGNNMARETAGSFYTIPTAAAWDGTFSDGDIVAVPYSGVFGTTSILTEEGWNVEFEIGMNPLKVDGIGTVDYEITGITARATCRPVATSVAALMTELRPEGLALGSTLRQSKNLVITGLAGGLVVTLYDAVMTETPKVWGSDSGRIGDITFEASRQLTGASPSTTMGAVFAVTIAAA